MKININKLMIKNLLISCAIYPILGQYYLKIAPISLGQILILLSTILYSFCYKKIKFNKSIFCTGLLMSLYNFIPALKYNSIINTVNNSLSILIFFSIISLSINIIKNNLNEFYSILKVCGLICTIFLFIQVIMHDFWGINIYGRISILDNWFKTTNDNVFIWIDYGRPDSLFYEPAHYCIYMTPILLLSLLYRKYFYAVIFGIGMILSTSTTGYAMIAICVSIYLFIKMNKNVKFFLIPIIVLCFIYMAFYNGVDMGKLEINSLNENIRAFGTLKYFKNFTLIDWISGIGFNRMAEWGSIYGMVNNNYSNSIFFMIFSFGFFGIGFILYFIIRLIKGKYWRPMILVMFIMLCSDQMCFNNNFGYLLICVLLCSYSSINEIIGKSIIKGEENNE